MGKDRSAEDRIYQHPTRYWGDFRDFSDVGGKREPLTPEGARYATEDRDEAVRLARERLEELRRERANQAPAAPAPRTPASASRSSDRIQVLQPKRLGHYAYGYLADKARSTNNLEEKRSSFEREEDAIENYLEGVRLAVGDPDEIWLHEFTKHHANDVRKALVNDYISPRTGRTLSSSSIRQAERAARSMFDFARFHDHVPGNHAPIQAIPTSITVENTRTAYLEPHEAAVFLEALIDDGGLAPPVGATFMLALGGMRPGAGTGILAADVNWSRSQIQVECNRYRSLKGGSTAHRVVPLWPQHALFLRAYQVEHGRVGRTLMFPTTSNKDGSEVPIDDMRKRWTTAQRRAGRMLEQHASHRVVNQLWDFRTRAAEVEDVVSRTELGEKVPGWLWSDLRHEPVGRVLEHPRLLAEAGTRARSAVREALRQRLDEKNLTPKVLRVTYCSTRLQTVDRHGVPITKEKVKDELGHTTSSMVDRVYSRVPDHAPRAPVVEYRLPDDGFSLPGADVFRDVLGADRAEEIYRDGRAVVTGNLSQTNGRGCHIVPHLGPHPLDSQGDGGVPGVGNDPTTYGLKVRCSAS